MRAPHFLQKFGEPQPGRIDINDKQFRIDLRGELFCFTKIGCYRSRVLRREFLQSRANSNGQGIVLFEQKNVTMRSSAGRLRRSRHVGNSSKFRE